MNQSITTLAPELRVHSLVGEDATSHLVVWHGKSLLIDCHLPQLRDWIAQRGLPMPDLILHTHVQPAHCREANHFPSARILVHTELVELASDPVGYARATQTRWDHPADWPITLGREKYGIAGSVTVFPPEKPLKIAGTFHEGERLQWQDLTLVVRALPGHGLAHVGFVLELAGESLAIFTGDLLRAPAQLVNIYDLEINYGGTALPSLPAILRSLAELPVTRYFPATGPVMADGPLQALALAAAIDEYHAALRWQSGAYVPAPACEYPLIGRYRQLYRGIYQIDNFGNCILLIDDQGRGLMFDPGPCDYESPTRVETFRRDLDLFESECGLRTIDLALITHVHGDHCDMAPVLRERFPECRVGALDLVAQVVRAPRNYPYAALLPWYNVGVEQVAVDIVLRDDTPHRWHDVVIRTIHLPGHCYCHAGYLLTFNGLRLALTGDTIQSRGEADGLSFIIANHSVPDEHSGILKSYQQMVNEPVDLNIGGHGSHFTNCAAMYAESLRRIEHALPYLRRLVTGGDLNAAFLRPGFRPLGAGAER
ncbi:MAG: Hydroxyacylglutathione hydrolase [Verrucomicrobiae bacterium]|nr:Hydroxyacylglutathione hydrolase [Verrucomicrobiae bacterium]